MATAMLHTADDVIEAMRERKSALALSDAALDDLAGLTGGHGGKSLERSRERMPNLVTLMSLVAH